MMRDVLLGLALLCLSRSTPTHRHRHNNHDIDMEEWDENTRLLQSLEQGATSIDLGAVVDHISTSGRLFDLDVSFKANGDDMFLEAFGHKFFALDERAGTKANGVQAQCDPATAKTSPIILPKNFIGDVKSRLMNSLTEYDEECFLFHVVDQLALVNVCGVAIAIRSENGKNVAEIILSWEMSSNTLNNLVGGLDWSPGADSSVGTIQCRIRSNTGEIRDADVELLLKSSEGAQGVASLVLVQDVNVRVKGYDREPGEFGVKGEFNAKFEMCPNMYGTDKVRTSFTDSIPLRALVADPHCRISFDKQYEGVVPTLPTFCSPQISEDGHFFCLAMKSVEFLPYYSGTPSSRTLSISAKQLAISPNEWLLDSELEGEMFILGSEPQHPNTNVMFRIPSAVREDVVNAADSELVSTLSMGGVDIRLRIASSQSTWHDPSTLGLDFSCQIPSHLQGKIKMMADFANLEQVTEKTLEEVKSSTDFTEKALKMLVLPFNDEIDQGSSHEQWTLAEIPFWGEGVKGQLYIEIKSLIDCDSASAENSGHCIFNDESPNIVSFGEGSYPPRGVDPDRFEMDETKLGLFGLVIPNLYVSYEKDEEISIGGLKPAHQVFRVPMFVALPANLNTFLGAGLLDDTAGFVELFHTLPKLTLPSRGYDRTGESGADGFLTKHIKNPDHGMELEAVIAHNPDKDSTFPIVSMTIEHLPINFKVVQDLVKNADISGRRKAKVSIVKENGYHSLQIKEMIDLSCPEKEESCHIQFPHIPILNRLFDKLGHGIAQEVFPTEPLAYDRTPPLKLGGVTLFAKAETGDVEEHRLRSEIISAYKDVEDLDIRLRDAFERTDRDLELLNTALTGPPIKDLMILVGADEFEMAKDKTEFCKILKGDVMCRGSIVCHKHDCDLTEEDAITKVKTFAANVIGSKALPSNVLFNLVESGRRTEGGLPCPILKVSFYISRHFFPKRLLSYFSSSELAESFPRHIEVEARISQDGNVWSWIRTKSGLQTEGFRTLIQSIDSDKPGLKGVIVRGLMMGLFQHHQESQDTEAILAVGTDMEMDYFDLRERPLDMMLQKRFMPKDCENNFDVPEGELPSPEQLGTTALFKNALFFIKNSVPIPTFADQIGMSFYSPYGTMAHVRLRRSFDYQMFNWFSNPAILQSPSYIRLPHWLDGDCMVPVQHWPTSCPAIDEIWDSTAMDLSRSTFGIAAYIARMLEISSKEGVKRHSDKAFELPTLLHGLTVEPSAPFHVDLPLVSALHISSVVITLSELRSIIIDQDAAKEAQLPIAPGTTESPLVHWRHCKLSKQLQSQSRMCLDVMMERLEQSMVEKPPLPLHLARLSLEQNITSNTLIARQSLTKLDQALSSLTPKPQSMDKVSDNEFGEFISFLQKGEISDLTTEEKLTQAGKTGLLFFTLSRPILFGPMTAQLKGVGALTLNDLLNGPSKLHHVLEIGAAMGVSAPDCQSKNDMEKDFCFTAVSHTYLGPTTREDEDLYLPSDQRSTIQMPVRDVCSQTRTIRPHKRRTLARTAMSGRAYLLGEQGEATLVATDNAVEMTVILYKKKREASDQQASMCKSKNDKFDAAGCRCGHNLSNCPLTSVNVRLSRVEVTTESSGEKGLDWQLDVVARNLPTKMILNAMDKLGISSTAERTTIKEIIRNRNVARLRFGDILLSDVLHAPGRVVIELCWEEGARCVRGQTYQALFLNPTLNAWKEQPETGDHTISRKDKKEISNYVNMFFGKSMQTS